MSITTIANAAFKQGFCNAIACTIRLLEISYNDCAAPGEPLHLPEELALVWRGRGWTYNDLVQAGVDDNDLAVLMSYKKQLNL